MSSLLSTRDHTSEVIYDEYATSLKALITTTKSLPEELSMMKYAVIGPHVEEWKKAMDFYSFITRVFHFML